MGILETLDSMTGREVAAAEDKAQMSIGSLADDIAPKQKLLAACAWQLRKRDEPALTFDEVFDQAAAQIMRDLERFDPAREEDGAGEQFPVVDDGQGAAGGAGGAEGQVLPGDGDPAE